MIYTFIVLLVGILIFTFGNAFGKHIGFYTNPSSILCYFWSIYILLPLLINPEKQINPVPAIYIFLTILSFSLSTILFNWEKARFINLKQQNLFNKINYSSLRTIFYILFTITLSCLFLDVSAQGFKVMDFVNNFYSSANSYIAKRYSFAIVPTIYASISNILIYVNATIGGILLGAKPKNKFFIFAFSILPGILITLLQGAKGTILLSLVLTAAGYFIVRTKLGVRELFDRKTFYLLIVFSVFMFLLFSVSLFSRGEFENNENSLSEIILSTRSVFNSYISGHLFAFSDWFTDRYFENNLPKYQDLNYPRGMLTFASFYNLFGTFELPHGVYKEYFQLGDIQSNIYTIYRGLIEDFTLLGSFLFIACSGVVSNFVFYRVLVKATPFLEIGIYVILLGTFYTSFIISIFIWKSIIPSALVLSLVLSLTYYKPLWK